MPDPLDRAGGIHSYVKSLAKGQRAMGLRPIIVHSITKTGSFEVDGEAHERGALHDLDPNVDRVHYHFALSALPFLAFPLSAPWRKLPRGFNFHGPWHLEGRIQGDSGLRVAAKRLLEGFVLGQFQRFTTDSEAFRSHLLSAHGVNPNLATTVLPGVDVDRFQYVAEPKSLRAGILENRSNFIIAAVRRLEPRMGLEDAIKAVKLLPDVSLVIAGTGSLRSDLETLVTKLELGERVRFLGRVSDDDLPKVFGSADLSIVPTRELEGFGLVVLESMATGTPVIATEVGGLREAMGPFATEWLVAARSPDSLADRIEAFRRDPVGRATARGYAESRDLKSQALSVERALGF